MRNKNAVLHTSIVDSSHKPVLRAQFFVNPVQRSFFFVSIRGFRMELGMQSTNLDIPFIASPGRFRPPTPFCAPRPSKCQHFSANSFTTQTDRFSFLEI